MSFYDYSTPDDVMVQVLGGDEMQLEEYLVFVDLDQNSIIKITYINKPLMPTGT